PKPDSSHGPSGLGVVLGLLMGAGAGHATGGVKGAVSEGLLGAITGGHASDVLNTLKNVTGRVAARPSAQAYLGNQAWLPGTASSAPTREQLVKLLMSNPQAGVIPNLSQ